MTAPTAIADTAPENPADPTTPTTVSADAAPTVQINGVVWSQVVVGSTVYAGGSFTSARPAGAAPGQQQTTRNNLLAYNINTGALITTFNPNLNGQVRSLALSPDGTRLYAGGDFTTVGGATRRRIAAFNAQTGALLNNFQPSMGYIVRAITATNTRVYAGGNFGAVGNVARSNLAAFNAADGALLDWAPVANDIVWSIVVKPDGTKVTVGGQFTTLNGSGNPGYGLGMVDATSGISLPFAVNNLVRNGTEDGAITTLATDADYVYGGGYTFGRSGGTWEGVFSASWNAGEIHMMNDCHGDTYSVFPQGPVIYQASHTHYCENLDGIHQGEGTVGSYPYFRGYATTTAPTRTLTWEPDQGRYYNFEGQPAPSMLTWYPDLNTGTATGLSQGPWSVSGNADYIVMGGEFTRVNNTNQQGLVRFARSGLSGNDRGPTLLNENYPLNVRSTQAGQVRVNFGSNQDQDNDYLTYRVYRDNQTAAGLVYTTSRRARQWYPYTIGYTDTGLTPGLHRYRVSVTDPFGNVVNSPWTDVTVVGSGVDSDYVKAVYGDQPTNYWRLGEASGNSLDTVGFRPATTGAGVTRGIAGAISGDADQATHFPGNNTGLTATGVLDWPPDVFSLEAWFKTSTTTGGKIVGWGTSATGTSQKADRHLYLDNTGRLNFGVRPNSTRVAITSAPGLNDNQWHHAVGTLSSTGLKLYVDGTLVANRADVTTAEHLSLGYWRIGGDRLQSWPNRPTSDYLNGDIDDVAMYKHELTPTQVAAHYSAATGAPPPNQPPIPSFTNVNANLGVTVDATASTDPDGTISSYAWDFGDGGTDTGATPAQHVYAAAGTYTITLTVTDDDNESSVLTRNVSVAIPPVASYTYTVEGLVVNVDGTASTDPDGNIVTYNWNWGDNRPSGSGVTSTHTYTTSGTFNLRLRVTDNNGATNDLIQQVTVVGPNQNPNANISTPQVNGLSVTVNGSTSTDSDGTITSYAWDFGDGGTDTGATPPAHVYAAGGTYTISLTVTDDDGATNTETRSVTVISGFAVDEFERTVANGWGTADTGGAWSVVGAAASYSVGAGVGQLRMTAAGAGPSVFLPGATSTNTELRFEQRLDKVATGSGTYLTATPRRVDGANQYYAKIRYLANGTISLTLGRIVSGTDTVLQTVNTAVTVAPGAAVSVKVQATGTAPTTLRARIWATGSAEPAGWLASVTDSTAALQAPGSVALKAFLSGTSTNAPVVASYDHLWAGPAV